MASGESWREVRRFTLHVFRDFGVGKPIISTLFRSDPAFGVRLAGNSFLCNTDSLLSGCLQDGNSYFRFRLRHRVRFSSAPRRFRYLPLH